eukprot:364462-Chlamydomonas_euryale.AAC.3
MLRGLFQCSECSAVRHGRSGAGRPESPVTRRALSHHRVAAARRCLHSASSRRTRRPHAVACPCLPGECVGGSGRCARGLRRRCRRRRAAVATSLC